MTDDLLHSAVKRRSFLRTALFGAGAAAVAPVLAGLPGMSVQAMGLNVSGNVRVAHLTGNSLQKAMGKFANTLAYQHGQAYLSAKSVKVAAPVDSGLDVFVETGGVWSTSETLVRDLGNARLISVQEPTARAAGLVISSGTGRYELVELTDNGAERVGVISRINGAVTIEMEGRAPVTLERPLPVATGK